MPTEAFTGCKAQASNTCPGSAEQASSKRTALGCTPGSARGQEASQGLSGEGGSERIAVGCWHRENPAWGSATEPVPRSRSELVQGQALGGPRGALAHVPPGSLDLVGREGRAENWPAQLRLAPRRH